MLSLRTTHAKGTSTSFTPLRSMLNRAFTLNRAAEDADAYFRSLGTIGVGPRQRVQMRFHLTKDAVLTRDLGEKMASPIYASFDALPKEQRATLRRFFNTIRENYRATNRPVPPP